MAEKTTLNLAIPLRMLPGQEQPTKNIGGVLADFLCFETRTADPLKFWGWAINLSEDKPLELDTADKEVFKTFVKNNDKMSAMLKAQILELLV